MSRKYNPSTDIPSLTDKVVLITGGTAGLGEGSVIELAKHSPAHIYFTGRNQQSADSVIAKSQKSSPNVPVSFIRCDVSSFASVKTAAADFKSKSDRLDLLMLNAGIMAVDPAVSADGFEIQFATNYLGHALLVELLKPVLLSTAQTGADVRIVNLTSIAYEQAPREGINFATLKSPQGSLGGIIPGHKWSRYGQSKLAQMLYSEEFAKHNPQLTSVSVHPGVILTGLFEKTAFLTRLPVLIMSMGKRTPVDEGHFNQVWAATCEKRKLQNGEFYVPLGVMGTRTTDTSKNQKLAEELWTWTQKELAPHLP